MHQSDMNQKNILGKITVAAKDQLEIIAKSTQYFMGRKEAAQKYLSGNYDDFSKEKLLEYMEFCNDNIKLILGL